MAFNINKLRTNPKSETDGVWVDAGAGLQLKIARLGNPNYSKRLNVLLKPLRSQWSGVGEISPGDVEKVTIQAMSECILLDWKNLTDMVGDAEVPVPYSPEKSLELLKIPDFAEIVSGFARKAELFRLGFWRGDLRRYGG